MSEQGWSRPRVTETVPSDQTIWFVSDLHLGDGTPSDAFFGKDHHLMALIRRVDREGGLLVVVGDALDVQQAWTLTRILRAHHDLLSLMSGLAQKGRLVYIVGNHDQDISLYRDLLHFRVCDTLHVGDQILVTHGHEHDPFIGAHLQTSDMATRWHHLVERYLDTWLRLPLGEFYNLPNRVMFWTSHKMGLLTLAIRQALEPFGIEGYGQRSLDQLDYWARSNMGDSMCMMGSVLNRLNTGPWPWLVCGHSHLPGLIRPANGQPGGYINTGSWTFASSQFARWQDGQFEVRDWISGREYGDELYQPVLTGAIDEKDFFQWWRENYMGWLRFREGEERRSTLRRWEGTIRDHQVLAQLPEHHDWNTEARPTVEAEPADDAVESR
ncbi:MAG: hypothetical protein AB8H79_19795 [Myxococcota bacterium]